MNTFKTPLLLIGALALATGSGCAPKRKDARYASTLASSLRAGSARVFFQGQVQPKLIQKCGDCHAEAKAGTEQSLNWALSYIGATASESELVKRSGNNHCANPILCGPDVRNTLEPLIQAWLQSAGNAAGDEVAASRGRIFTSLIKLPAQVSGCKVAADLRGPRFEKQTDANGNTITVQTLPNKCWQVLRYSAKQLNPSIAATLHRGWFEVEIARIPGVTEGPEFAFRNLRAVSLDKDIYVHSVKTFISGVYRPDRGIVYDKVDQIIAKTQIPANCRVSFDADGLPNIEFNTGTAWEASLQVDPNGIRNERCKFEANPLANISANDSGVGENAEAGTGFPANVDDTLSFSFEYYQEGTARDCKDMPKFRSLVFNKIVSGLPEMTDSSNSEWGTQPRTLLCLDCHRSTGSMATPAGQRFNMHPKEFSDHLGLTYDDRVKKVCQGFLQRSNLDQPLSSLWLTQVRTGLNGMPPQPGYEGYENDLCCWIKAEATAYGKTLPTDACGSPCP